MSKQLEMKARLQKAGTLNEVFDIVDEFYDLDEPLNGLKKGTVLIGINKVLQILKPKERK